MRIIEVIDLHPDQDEAIGNAYSTNTTLDHPRPTPSLLALLYQAITRDGWVIGPGAIQPDFDQGDSGDGGDDRWNPNLNSLSGYHE